MEKVSVCKAGFALCRGAFLHVSKCASKPSGRERSCSLLSESGHLAVSGTKGFCLLLRTIGKI